MLRIIITKAFSLYYYNLVLAIYQIRGVGKQLQEVPTYCVHPHNATTSICP